MEKTSIYSLELVELAKNISCNFIDARTTTKDYLKKTVLENKFDEIAIQPNHFVVSTCLRYEVYSCGNEQKHEDPFLFVTGLTCVRRLLSILVGLHSEIIGEKEILIQVSKSIDDSYTAGLINESTFQSLQKLIDVSKKIRKDCELNNNENYSTIAADIFVEHLSDYDNATVAIVGGGYMADKFFSSLLEVKSSVRIKKIFWINRGTSRLSEYVNEISHWLDIDIEVLDLEEGRSVLRESDAIFSAISKSPKLYSNEKCKEGALIVDVSYPQVFDEKNNNINFITISNTDFNSLVKRGAVKANINLANSYIDNIMDFIMKNS